MDRKLECVEGQEDFVEVLCGDDPTPRQMPYRWVVFLRKIEKLGLGLHRVNLLAKMPKAPPLAPPKPKAALVFWGNGNEQTFKVPERILASLESRYEVFCFGGDGEVIDFDTVRSIKSQGIRTVVVYVFARDPGLSLFLGDLHIAGMTINLVDRQPKPWVPSTQLKRQGKPTGQTSSIPGTWQKLAPHCYRWVPRRWTYEELRDVEVPFEASTWVFRNEDLAGSWQVVEGKEEPILDFQVSSPFQLDLTGWTLGECPTKYIDWLLGQDWTYGTFAEQLRQWASQPVVECERAKWDDRSFWTFLSSDSTGYWDSHDRYVQTMMQGGNVPRHKWDTPTWLGIRDPWGRVLSRTEAARYRSDLLSEYHEREDPCPSHWTFTCPWAAESLDSQGGGLTSDDLEVGEWKQYTLLEEDLPPAPKREWVVDPEAILSQLVERSRERAIERGRAARASGDPEKLEQARSYYRHVCFAHPWQKEKAGALAELNAWYLAIELLESLERLTNEAELVRDREHLADLKRQLEECETGMSETALAQIHKRSQTFDVVWEDTLTKARRAVKRAAAEVKHPDRLYRAQLLCEALWAPMQEVHDTCQRYRVHNELREHLTVLAVEEIQGLAEVAITHDAKLFKLACLIEPRLDKILTTRGTVRKSRQDVAKQLAVEEAVAV